jgi:hypothetical protein
VIAVVKVNFLPRSAFIVTVPWKVALARSRGLSRRKIQSGIVLGRRWSNVHLWRGHYSAVYLLNLAHPVAFASAGPWSDRLRSDLPNRM